VQNSSTLKNLFFLLISFLVGIVMLVSLDLYFSSLVNGLDQKVNNLKVKFKIGKFIINDAYKLRYNFFELSAATNNKLGRDIIYKRIKRRILDIKKELFVLDHGGTFKKKIKLNVEGHKNSLQKVTYVKESDDISIESLDIIPKLNQLEDMIKVIMSETVKRDLNFKNKETKKMKRVMSKLRSQNKRAPAFFNRLQENIQRILYESNIKLKKLKHETDKKKEFYKKLEFILILVTVMIVMIFGFIMAKQINKSNETLQIKIKDEVRKSREKDQAMIHQTKLAQMGEMMSMIAHQWRQPLSAISANSNDLTMKLILDNYSKDYFVQKLEKISSLSKHLSETIDDFREFYKEDKEKVEIFYSSVIQSTLDIVLISIENKNIKLITDFNSTKKINTYPNELKQVILNLIKNAEDVLLEKNVNDPYIHIKTYDDEIYSYLEISDNGGGIPVNIIDKIFDPYFSTKTQKDGTGLGLYMSKTIIEEHCKGELKVYNDKLGAVFEIKLFTI